MDYPQGEYYQNTSMNRIQLYSRRGRAMLLVLAMVFVLNVFQWLLTYAYWGRVSDLFARVFPNLLVFYLFCTFIYLVILAAAAILSHRLMNLGDTFNRWQPGLSIPGYMPPMPFGAPGHELDESQSKYLQFFIEKSEREAETKFPLALTLVTFVSTVEILSLMSLFYIFIAFDSVVNTVY